MGGRYRIERTLGQGGMGSVLVATDLSLQRPVALKLLHGSAAADPALRARFEQEARTLASLSHPNLAVVHDFQASTQPAYLIMELVQGETLRALLNRERQLPLARAVRIAQQILAGLGAAHAAGIVHRDIKPSNVMLTGGEHVKVVDFGVAKIDQGAGRALTAEGSVIGTLQYMPPEQAAGRGVGPSADVYAVGVCLFEMLAGYNPFAVGEMTAVYRAVLELVPPDLRQIRADVPAQIAEGIARALAKDPSARPASASQLASALGGVLDSASGTLAGPATLAGPTWTSPTLGGPTLAGPPSFASGPASLVNAAAPAPAQRSTGLWIAIVFLLAALVAASAVAGVLFYLHTSAPPAAASAAASASTTASSPSAASAPPAVASAAPSAPSARGTARPPEPRPSGKSTPAPAPSSSAVRGDRCVCVMNREQKSGEGRYLCPARQTPQCICQVSSNSGFCDQPWQLVQNQWTCPGASNKRRAMPAATTGQSCMGYSEDEPSTRVRGKYDCDFCGANARPGVEGAPCEGYVDSTGAKETGTLVDCR